MMQQWREKFSAMSPREKYLIAGAALVCTLLLGFTFLIEPVNTAKSALKISLDAEQARQASLEQQQALYAAALRDDPDAPVKEQAKRLTTRLDVLSSQFADELGELVGPGEIPLVIDRLFKRAKALSLQEMRSLPVTNLFEDNTQMQGVALYQHSLVLTFTGSYFAVRNFLQEIEQGPDALYWHNMRYAVSDYPNAEVTLQIYTLSTEKAFIRVD